MQDGIARIEQNLTSDHAQAAKALRLPMGMRGANGSPYFSLSDLIKRWPESTARREVLMVSDGIDRYYGSGDLDDPYLDEAIDDAQRAGILVSAIYTPGVGHFGHSYWQTYWGQLYLAQLADKTGGEAYYIGFNGPPVSFAPYLEDLDAPAEPSVFSDLSCQAAEESGMAASKAPDGSAECGSGFGGQGLRIAGAGTVRQADWHFRSTSKERGRSRGVSDPQLPDRLRFR